MVSRPTPRGDVPCHPIGGVRASHELLRRPSDGAFHRRGRCRPSFAWEGGEGRRPGGANGRRPTGGKAGHHRPRRGGRPRLSGMERVSNEPSRRPGDTPLRCRIGRPSSVSRLYPTRGGGRRPRSISPPTWDHRFCESHATSAGEVKGSVCPASPRMDHASVVLRRNARAFSEHPGKADATTYNAEPRDGRSSQAAMGPNP